MTSIAPADLDVVVRDGWDALRRGDAQAARVLFERATAGRPGEANAWYGLAFAHRLLGAVDAHLLALDRALAVAPNHILALMMKAEHFAAIGDGRSAHAFYDAAVRRAPPPASLPPDVRAALSRADQERGRLAKQFETSLLDTLRNAGVEPARATGRGARALELLLGRSQVFLQSPTALYFPELAHRQFFERGEFEWIAQLEARTSEIREELLGVLADDAAAFSPYISSDSSRPPTDMAGLLDNPRWSAFYLYKGGEVVAGAADRCPRTMAALEGVPLSSVPGRTPSVLFSLLRPRSHIPPHTGQMNTRLICHLPLIVPTGCALRVGSETRTWKEGETLIFDDSIEHEAWNRSDRLRVVLLFEVWRPELSQEERELVAAMLSAVPNYDNG
jgi:aspartyl/asparaginyl beta-hydroxylase (cupin superfamily)